MRGADTRTGELAPDQISGAAFGALGENSNRPRGWIRYQQVHVVGLAVELDQLGFEVGAHAGHGVFLEGEHGVGEHPAPVVG
jgi:hypothetical protein